MAERQYTPAQVCDIFDISKSTLFRWERDGRIAPPDRDLHGQRLYSQEHMSEIGTFLYHKLYEQLAGAENEPGAQERLSSLQERMALAKFIYFGNIEGLYELAERDTISGETVQKLLREASQRDPADRAFRLIVKEIVCSRVLGSED